MSKPTLAEYFADVEARREKTTKGPWQKDMWDHPCFIIEAPGHLVFQTVGGNDEANANFVVHSYTDVEILLKMVKRLLGLWTPEQQKHIKKALELYVPEEK